jgi:hypothetical protein
MSSGGCQSRLNRAGNSREVGRRESTHGRMRGTKPGQPTGRTIPKVNCNGIHSRLCSMPQLVFEIGYRQGWLVKRDDL